jgi:hypothetical protein
VKLAAIAIVALFAARVIVLMRKWREGKRDLVRNEVAKDVASKEEAVTANKVAGIAWTKRSAPRDRLAVPKGAASARGAQSARKGQEDEKAQLLLENAERGLPERATPEKKSPGSPAKGGRDKPGRVGKVSVEPEPRYKPRPKRLSGPHGLAPDAAREATGAKQDRPEAAFRDAIRKGRQESANQGASRGPQSAQKGVIPTSGEGAPLRVW